MVMSSVGAGLLPCVLFYRFPFRFSRSAHRLSTGRKFLRRGGGHRERTLFVNGGAGQFVVVSDSHGLLHDALAALARHYCNKTGGEARIAFGFAELGGERPYQEVASEAKAELQVRLVNFETWQLAALGL